MAIDKVNGTAFDNIANLNGVAKASIGKFNAQDATSGGSGIITANLVQYLDAGNSSSYSGSGTTWSDLTASAVNGTLVNSPTYSSSEGGGSFLFDSVDEYMKFPYDDAAPIRIGEDSGEVNLISTGSGTRTYGDVDTDGGITCAAENNETECVLLVPDGYYDWNGHLQDKLWMYFSSTQHWIMANFFS